MITIKKCCSNICIVKIQYNILNNASIIRCWKEIKIT